MPTLLLVRHGQASFGAADYDVLSPHGEVQAERVAAEIARQGVALARVTAGSMRRQQQTAAPIAAPAGLEVQTDARWNEYDTADVLGAHSDTQARPSGPHATVDSDAFQDLLDPAMLAWIAAGASSSAHESWPAFVARTSAALDDAAAALGRGQTGLVATSGGVIAAVCLRLLGLPDTAYPAFNRVAANGGMTKIVVGRRGMSLIAFNEHGHLLAGGASLVTYR